MKTSEQINDIAEALAKAQSAIKAVPRDKTVTVKTKTGASYKFAYAPFETIVEAVRKPLGDNGLAFIQATTRDESGLSLVTRLIHQTGQWIETSIPVDVMERGAQALGSATTYSKRYALTLLLGIAADDDDDGNAADGNTAQAAPSKPIAGTKSGAPDQRVMAPEEEAEAMAKAQEWADALIEQIQGIEDEPALDALWQKSEAGLKRLHKRLPDAYQEIMNAEQRARDRIYTRRSAA